MVVRLPNSSLPPVLTAQGRAQRAARERSTTAIYIALVARALDESGIASATVLRAADITIAAASDPQKRLPVSALNRLFSAAVAATADPYFGLKIASRIQITHLHALGHGLAVSGTLMEFCVRLQRYMRLVSQACEVELVERGDEVCMTLVLQEDVQAAREDAFLAFLVMSMRSLHKRELNPVRVEFHHAMPQGGSEPYVQLFNAPVLFERANPALSFRTSDLHQALVGASPELAVLHDKLATRDLARLDKADVVAVVRQKIVGLLPAGACTRDQVAASMGMRAATLQLRLARQGTNFNRLLDMTRKELAASYVRQLDLPLYDVTSLLGFSDASHFSRAFRRWEGTSPSALRKRLGG